MGKRPSEICSSNPIIIWAREASQWLWVPWLSQSLSYSLKTGGNYTTSKKLSQKFANQEVISKWML